MNQGINSNLQKNNGKINRDRTFLYLTIVVIFLLLAGSSNKILRMINSPTGAAISIELIKNTNYLLGFIVFAFLLIVLFLAFSLFKKRKEKKQLPELPLEKLSLDSLKTKKPLGDKLDQVNQELKNLRTEKKRAVAIPKKLTRLPNLNERKLNQELNEESAFMPGSDRPLILEAPQDKKKLDNDLLNIEKEIAQLDQQEFKMHGVFHPIRDQWRTMPLFRGKLRHSKGTDSSPKDAHPTRL